MFENEYKNGSPNKARRTVGGDFVSQSPLYLEAATLIGITRGQELSLIAIRTMVFE